MKHYLVILLSTSLVDNLVLSKFLGLCPLMGTSRRLETAFGLGCATAAVLVITSLLNHLTFRWLLEPAGLTVLRPMVFIVLIAATVQLMEILIRAISPVLDRRLGLYLPLITTNCAVLGVSLLNATLSHDLLESLAYALGTAIGFILILVFFAALRTQLERADVPAPFKGMPIALCTLGLIAMGFMGLKGLVGA